MITSKHSHQWPTLVLIAALCATAAITAAPAAAQPAKPAGGKHGTGEITTFKREGEPKKTGKEADKAAEEKKKGPKEPGIRRDADREKTSVEDIDDELTILRELLEIERGSDTEADTLLELSYVLWDRAEAYELEAYDQSLEIAIGRCEASGDKQECKILKVKQANLLERSRASKMDVIANLKRIERNFPRYAKLDEVLYSLGFHLGEVERPSESADAYMRLVRKTPDSGYMPDAYLGIGNYYFGKNQPAEALKWYTKVTDFPKSSVYGWGLYYIAWVAYNTNQWDTATKGFIRVLDYSKNEAGNRVTFTEDATRYLVKSWAETGNPKNALNFFKKVAPGSETILLLALALHYIEVSEFAKSNLVIDDLVDFAKDDKQIVRYLTLRLDNSYKLHDLDQTVHSATMVGNALKVAPKAARPQLELLLAEVASTFHSEYENTLIVPTLEAAEKVYRVYGEHFSEGEHGYDMLHNHALALFQLADRGFRDSEKMAKEGKGEKAAALREQANSRWIESASAYERVISMQANGKYAESAAHRAFIAYYKMERLNQETATKDQDTADLRQVPLKSDQQRVADACDRYVAIALKNNSKEDVPEALFVGGRLWYQHNYFAKSGQMLAAFMERFADHDLAQDAARMMLSSYALGQDGKNLIKWTDVLIKDQRFNQGKLGETLVQVKSNEEYNKCLELKETPVAAAECLKAYANKYPDRENAATALAGAARFYRDAHKRDEVIATYKALAKTFPKHPKAVVAMLEIGDIYRDSAAFDDAATAYEDFVQNYPDAKKLVPEALDKAMLIREGLGQYDKVVEAGELFLQNFPNDERAVTVAYNLTVQYIKKNDWKGVARASDKFLKRSLNIPTHYRLAAQVNTGTAQFKLAMGDKGRKLFDEVVISAKQLAEKNEMGTLDAIGRDAIAQALFMTGEIEFEKVKLIKGNYKKLEEATKLAAKKIEAAKIAEGFYAMSEDSKNPRWVAAAASRRGRIHQEIAISIKTLPPPPALAKDPSLQGEWAAQLAEKAKPEEDRAVERYRAALKKAAEIFAFDSYFAEARDNLKALDTKFAELADMKEYSVELVPVKWNESGKPDAAVRDLRMKLFDLNESAAPGGGSVEKGDTVQTGNPALAGAYTTLVQAHHALGQYRDELLVASVAMAKAVELKKSAALLNTLALAHNALGNIQQALNLFKAAAAADPKATEPLMNAASITVRNLGFAETVELLDEVLKRDPGNYWATVTRPVAVRRVSDDLAKAKEALVTLDEMAKKDSRPELHFNRCVIAQALLTKDTAELKKALAACEDAVKAVGSKHEKYKELKKRADGLRQAIEFAPTDAGTPPKKDDADKAKPEADKPAEPAKPAPAADPKMDDDLAPAKDADKP